MSAATLKSIDIYPIKSTAAISLSTAWVDELGLAFDRRFVLTNITGQCITARTAPALCLITANLTASGLILSAPNMPKLVINTPDFSTNYQQVAVWSTQINALHCCSEYDKWFSRYLNSACQLLYFGERSQRQVKNSQQQVAFADGYPLLLIAQSSLSDLNNRFSLTMPMARFRPNLVVENCQPFAEDTWQHIRIGEVEFELTKPCSRCIFTTLDPVNAELHPQQEPLRSLKYYRQLANGEVLFGQNMIALNQGRICLGDPVEVLATKTAPQFLMRTPKSSTQPVSVPVLDNQSQAPVFSLRLSCVKILADTHDVKTFVLKNSTNEPIHYLAGQHLPISITIEGKQHTRCYTLSSTPTRNGYLSITVKRVADNGIKGVVSNYFHDHFTVGDTISAAQPQGSFHLNKLVPEKVLLLSAGSGITPMLAMLKYMTDIAATNDIVFFHSAHSEADLIGASEVQALAHQHNKCVVEYTLTRSAKPSWQGYQGHIGEQMLTNISDLTDRQVYVCGPLGFRNTVKASLDKLALPEENYHFESFGLRPTTPKPNLLSKRNKNNQLSIVFDPWNKTITGNNQETLLEQAENAGLMLPYSCRAGMCGSCIVKLVTGEVEQLADDALSESDKHNGHILACSCIPKTDIVIEKIT